jgi:hypothetical protein
MILCHESANIMDPLDLSAGAYHFSPEGLRLISKCPLCSEQYQPFQASIVEEKADAQLVHITCRKCQSSVVALIVDGHLGLSSIGLITDLSSSDVERFKTSPAITEQHIFAAYKELKDNKSDLRKKLLTS